MQPDLPTIPPAPLLDKTKATANQERVLAWLKRLPPSHCWPDMAERDAFFTREVTTVGLPGCWPLLA